MVDSPDDVRPLLGKRVMVTRPPADRDPLVERLQSLGAEVVFQPAIRIGPPKDWRPVDDALGRLNQFEWLVFLSANGVRGFCNRCGTSLPLGLRIAAIGPGTADELARYGLKTELVPEQYRAEALAEALIDQTTGRRFLLVRASRGREVLAEQLAAAGAIVEQIVVYSSEDVQQADPAVADMLHAGGIDWITVTSSAIAKSLARLFGNELKHAKLVSISPVTSAVLRELGHPPAAEATEYTMAGLVLAILQQSQ